MDLGTRTRACDQFVRSLLATTCLTVAAAASAQAGVFTEVTDFPGFPDPEVLPVGTTEVNGLIDCFCFDDGDFFQFTGLLPGSSFSLIFTNQPGFELWWTGIFVSDSSFNHIGEGAIYEGGGSVLINGVIPDDGKLQVFVGSIEEGGGLYRVSLDAAQDVPEPATVIPAGLALAGALAWQRRKQKCS